MVQVRDRVDVTIYRDPGAYIAHPCVSLLANGDLLVAFNETLPRRPWQHSPRDPRFVNLMARSPRWRPDLDHAARGTRLRHDRR